MLEGAALKSALKQAFASSPMMTLGAPAFLVALSIGYIWIWKTWYFAALTLAWTVAWMAEDLYWKASK